MEKKPTDTKQLQNENVITSQGKLLKLLPETYTVLQCPLKYMSRISNILSSTPSFFSLSITPEEISIILSDEMLLSLFDENGLQQLTNIEKNWRCFKVEGPLDFGLVGILHGILDPLKSAGISVLAIGTYNTDYFLIKEENLEKATNVLRDGKFHVNL